VAVATAMGPRGARAAFFRTRTARLGRVPQRRL